MFPISLTLQVPKSARADFGVAVMLEPAAGPRFARTRWARPPCDLHSASVG
jgi:hypothetical protein